MTASSTPPNPANRSSLAPLRWWSQITVLLLVVVELCWIVPWYRTLLQISFVASPQRAALVLGGVMLAAYLVTKALESLRLIKGIQLGVLVALFASSLLFAEVTLLNSPISRILGGMTALDPGAVLVIFFVLWLWWRGITLGRDTIRPFVAFRRFELGLLLFMAHVLILTRMVGGSEKSAAGLGLFVFFLFVGLLSVIFARIAYVGTAKGMVKNPFDRRWLGSTLGILGLAVGLAAVFGSLLTGQYRLLLDMAGAAVRWLVVAFIFVVSVPWLLLTYLLGPLIPVLRQSLARPTLPATSPYPIDPGTLPPVMTANEPRPIPAAAVSLIFWAILLLLFVVILNKARLAFRRGPRAASEEPESLLESGEARKLFRQALQDAAGRLVSRFRPGQRVLAAARVRQIYAALMDLCVDLNHPRPASKTPLEFMPVLGELFSDQIDDLELITNAYNKVRYGGFPETQEELDALEKAWKHVFDVGMLLKKAGRGVLKTAEVKDVRRMGT